MTEDQLRKAEAAYQAAFRRSEAKREARNDLIRDALREGWSHARIAGATGMTRARVGQISLALTRRS
jgi:hypothetical protein